MRQKDLINKNNMKNWTKFYDFAVIVVAVFAAIGGTAYLFYDHHALFGVTNICLVAMAIPYVRKRAKDLME